MSRIECKYDDASREEMQASCLRIIEEHRKMIEISCIANDAKISDLQIKQEIRYFKMLAIKQLKLLNDSYLAKDQEKISIDDIFAALIAKIEKKHKISF